MKLQIIFIFVIGLQLLAVTASRGQVKCDEIFVESWKTGNEKITEQKFDVNLSPNNQIFKNVLVSNSGKQYKLLIKHIPITEETLSETGKTTESWVVELREILSVEDEMLGDNLLRYGGIGGGGDYFPREDLIGYLYLKDRSKIKRGDIYLIDGSYYYPSKSKRIIKVDGFYVTIQMKDFQLNSQDRHKVDFLNVSIEFRNTNPSCCTKNESAHNKTDYRSSRKETQGDQ